MENPSSEGMLYHEAQESKLCAVHCVNTILQGPFFSEIDLAALAYNLDQMEFQIMLEGDSSGYDNVLHFGYDYEESHNVSMDGNFSIQVLQKALEVWDLQTIPLAYPVADPSHIDPEVENAFVCHFQDHWFSIRKVNGEWYNFDSLYPAPNHLSKFQLSAYLDSLKGFGWSVFIVRGNFPKECPLSSADASNSFGHWFSPDDAKRIAEYCHSMPYTTDRASSSTQPTSHIFQKFMESLSEHEDEDFKAAIAASLMDSGSASAKTGIPYGHTNAETDDNSSCPTSSKYNIPSNSDLYRPFIEKQCLSRPEDEDLMDSGSSASAKTDIPDGRTSAETENSSCPKEVYFQRLWRLI